jgi:elongation factor P
MKDIEQGTKTNQRFRTEDKVERAFVDARDMQYLYQDGESYVFMDQENFEQINLSADFLESQSGFLMPEMKVQVNFYNGRPIGIQLPPSVVLTVSDTEPGIKNSTATNSFKPAKMETGVTVQVPAFISTGDRIKVDTNEGKYMERA